jgi:hypothetical protein
MVFLKHTVMKKTARFTSFMLICFFIFQATIFASGYNPLPDTGIHKCYDNNGNNITCPIPGLAMAQDGSYDSTAGKIQKSFTNNGDGTVTDNNIGLIWQQSDNGTTMTWTNAMSYCSNLTLAGYSDWRLPTIRELALIIDHGNHNPAIDTTVFSCRSNYYWSSTSYAPNNSDAWYVYFDDGYSNWSNKTNSAYVRCVRGGPYNIGSYKNNGDGTISHLSTGLMWQQSDNGTKMTWAQAISYCETLNHAGYTDWRLPDIQELLSIVDYSTSNPAANSTLTCRADGYWSSSPYAQKHVRVEYLLTVLTPS